MKKKQLSQTEENYLKQIFKLSEKNDGSIQTNAIAEALSTSAASVTDMIKKLSEKDLLTHIRYKGAKLTAAGDQIARMLVRRHRLWEVFLVEKLNFKWDEVHDLAEDKVVGVKDHDSTFLSYLDKSKIALGTGIEVVEVNAFDQSIDIQINGKKKLNVSQQVARNLFVQEE